MIWIGAALVLSVAGVPQSDGQPPPPPDTAMVHPYVWFDHGAVERMQPAGFDALDHVAGQIPPDAYVLVTGKADTSGDADFNQALSLRRARFIADFLVARGVSPERITLRACGERDLNRVTPDDTPEALNRSGFVDWRSQPPGPSLNCEQVSYR